MKYQVKDPQGAMHVIEGPEGATPDQVIAQAQKLIPSQKNPGIFGRAWNALGVPERMSRKGLNQMASFVPKPEPTGNQFMDIAKGTPRIAADTMAEAAPGFVSPLALLTEGAMPVLRGAGKVAEVVGPGIGRQLESLSGMKPGLLGKAFKDPSLIFAKIPEEARAAYRAAQPVLRQSKMITETANPMALAQKALKAAEAGTLLPEEAMEGRKVIDQLWGTKRVTKAWADAARARLDKVAKSSESIAQADRGFARGMDAAGLRQILPQNKYGGTSAFKTAIMAGANAMGTPGKIAMAAMSPVAMGAGATALGTGAKAASPFVNNPKLAVAVQQLIARLIGQQGQ